MKTIPCHDFNLHSRPGSIPPMYLPCFFWLKSGPTQGFINSKTSYALSLDQDTSTTGSTERPFCHFMLLNHETSDFKKIVTTIFCIEHFGWFFWEFGNRLKVNFFLGIMFLTKYYQCFNIFLQHFYHLMKFYRTTYHYSVGKRCDEMNKAPNSVVKWVAVFLNCVPIDRW